MIKKTIRKILPESVYNLLRSINYSYRIKRAQLNHKVALKQVGKKEKIKVAFFIYYEAEWKFEGLYRLMENDNRFEPVIVIVPWISYGKETMLLEMRRTYKYFKNKEYNVVLSLNEKTGEWLNVKKEIQPDIVFLINPWGSSRPEYQIDNYNKILTCYVSYTFVISYLYQGYFNKPVHNLVWKFFLETQIHKQISKQYARNKGINTLVSGYPGMDKLLQKDYRPVDVWKIKDKNIKRIIWSPHHTISGMGGTLDYSTFLKYYDFMLDFAAKYQHQIQISFKPHPSLRPKLNMEEYWGKEKTDKYFQKWEQLPNGQLNDGEYIDLFATSDGMINDSSAFVMEYQFTNKPELFLANDDSILDRFNEVGKMTLSKLYIGKCQDDIERFLKNVIIGGKDSMKNERINFFNSVIKPPNNVTASENIYNCLKSEIFGKEN